MPPSRGCWICRRTLSRVMSATPAEIGQHLYARHNLDEIAFRIVPQGEPTTLEYFMNDYVDHLEHHLAQILS